MHVLKDMNTKKNKNKNLRAEIDNSLEKKNLS